MMKRIHKTQTGFTIVELMVATTVFSTVLLLMTYGLLEVGRTYYKGATAIRTQESARSIIQEMGEAIQFGGGAVTTLANAPDGSQGFCVGGKEFSYIRNRQVVESGPGAGQSLHAMVVRDNVVCGAAAQAVTGSPVGRELVNTRMRITHLSMTRQGTTDLYNLFVRVVSGDTTDLEDRLNASGQPGTDTIVDSCRQQRDRSKFCSASELSTVIQKRVR